MNRVNPFDTPITTSDLSATDAVELFSDVFAEFHILLNTGHTFLNGARGSGKTMMFRLMQPDCRLLTNNCKIKDLDFIGIYMGIKTPNFNKTEFVYLKNHADSIISEHYLTTNITTIIFNQLAKLDFDADSDDLKLMTLIYEKYFSSKLKDAGWKIRIKQENAYTSINEIFAHISLECIEILKVFNDFSDNLFTSARNDNISYSSILLKYSNFLVDLLENVRLLKCMPTGKPFYIMIDDADNLNNTQKQILNTWISFRTINTICFKISTQLNYKYFKTLFGDRIETPHDYSEINIADRYTSSNRSFYKERIKDVVKRRLSKVGLIDSDPYAFFPPDVSQDNQIKKLREEYYAKKIAECKDEKQAYDYSYRYARPDFIKNLRGNRNTYSYSGFDQLVHISSGNMRQFIEPAKDMYYNMVTEQLSNANTGPILEISPKVQDEVIRNYSYKSFVTYFDKLKDEKNCEIEIINNDPKTDTRYKELKKEKIKSAISDLEKLSNLINALGRLFNRILLSNASERRVFSVALNDEPNEELKKVLNLGVELGFLQEYSIGNKYGTGKSRLYILNRIVSPNFGLDPSSFAGYKFVNSNILELAIKSTLDFDKYLRTNGLEKTLDIEEPTLFSQIEE